MEYFVAEGSWWLPGNTEPAIRGSLSFDATGLTLVLRGRSLEPPGASFGQSFALPVVHGRLDDGREASLLSAIGLALGTTGTLLEADYQLDLALLGCHTIGNAFAEVEAEFDYLDAWLAQPLLQGDGDSVDGITSHPDRFELAVATWGSDAIKITASAARTREEARVKVDRQSSFSIAYGQPAAWREIVDGGVRCFHDLLTLTLGRSARMTSLRLRPHEAIGSNPGACEAYFTAIQPEGSAPRPVTGVNAPTILTAEDAPGDLGPLLERWFALWSDDQEGMALLLAPDYAPFMYTIHRFLSTFQAAEAVAKKRFDSRELDPAVYKANKQAVNKAVADLNGDVIAWLNGKLSRNDKRLKDLLQELVRSTGAVGDAVLDAAPSFASDVTQTRSGGSHGGSDLTAAKLATLHWRGEVLRWILRTRLLSDLGITDVEERVREREPFRHAVEQLRPTP